MTFSNEQTADLKAPLRREHVKQRSQAGRALSYLEGWFAIAEANRIFGFDGWDREMMDIRQVGEAHQDAKQLWRVAYIARVRIIVCAGARNIIRDGTGYGSGIDRDIGSAHESATKEAETDAMKRALMTFGNPFGLALYDKEQREVVDSGQTPADDGPINEGQALALRRLVTDVGADIVKYLAYLKVERIEDLPRSRYDAAVAALEAKRKQAA